MMMVSFEPIAGDTVVAINAEVSVNETDKEIFGKLLAHVSVASSVYDVAVATITRVVDKNNDGNNLDAGKHFGKAGSMS